MKIFIPLFLLLFILNISCKKDTKNTPTPPPVPTTGNLISDKGHVIDSTSVITVTDTYIVLVKSANYKPIMGDILFLRPFSGSPLGMISKVISVSENSNKYTCSIVRSNLNEAFKQLNINYTYNDTFSTSQAFRTGSTISVTFNANNTIANGIGLDGTIKFFLPTTKIEVVKANGSLIPQKILIQTDFGIDESTLEIKSTSSSSINVVSEVNLKTFLLPVIYVNIPIVTPLGAFIIPVPFTQQISIRALPISISGKAKFVVTPQITATLGVKYENSTWTNLCSYSINTSANPLVFGDFDPTLSVVATATIVKPVYEIKPYGLDALKAFFEIPNNVELNVQRPSPNYSLKYKLDVTGGVKQSFWTGVDQEYSLTGHLIEKTLLEGDFIIQSPALTTNVVNSVSYITALLGGNIISQGSYPVTERGVCWSVSPNPNINGNKKASGSGFGSFDVPINGLAPNTTYYVRSYAITSRGVTYGNEIQFTTLQSSDIGTVTDYDGNTYYTIKIGTQIWMMENLKTVHYRNGTPVIGGLSDQDWLSTTAGAYTTYNDNSTNTAIYGRLYNWFAATDSRNIAPSGWHVPNNADWDILMNYLGGNLIAGDKLKATVLWDPPVSNSTNSTGFTGLPGGFKRPVGTFMEIGIQGLWWSSSNFVNPGEGSLRALYSLYSGLDNTGGYNKNYGLSIRCLKD